VYKRRRRFINPISEELNMIRPSESRSRRKPHAFAAALSILVATLGVAQAAHANPNCYSTWTSPALTNRDASVTLIHIGDGHTQERWFQSCTQVDTANASAGLYVQYSTNAGAPSGQQNHFQGQIAVNCQDGSQHFSSWHADTAPNDNDHPEEIVSCGNVHPTSSYAMSWTNYFSTCPTKLTYNPGNGNYWYYDAGLGFECPMGQRID
jgi:hypothetical protein